tara:strand:- start:1193 stop:2065 length:873 start_codon:yes stop_codon:yes gene_type:complete
MADITATQKQALSGMNMSDHEERMKELEAELEAVKARIAETKANIANLKADQKLIETAQTQDRQLEGERGEDGSLITATAEEEIPAAPDKGIATEREDFTEAGKRQESERAIADENYEAELEEVNKKFGVEGDGDAQKDLDAFELQDYYRHKLEVVINSTAEKNMIADKQDIDEDDFIDVESETRDVESNVEQDRAQTSYPSDETGRGEKAGWEMAEGGNTWSINEKDDYWKTEEGFDEAMNLYGQKPSWLKEPTLVYNPETDEYEEIEEEEFEDLSRPAVSADIKKLFG